MRTVKIVVRKAIIFAALACFMVGPAVADELVQTIQKDLIALGYFSEATDGELDLPTQIAIGKFEEANGMSVTGQPSIALATKTSTAVEKLTQIAPAAGGNAVRSTEQARQECLDQKKAEAEQSAGKKKLFGKLGQAGSKLLGRFGNNGLARDVYDIQSTVNDVSSIAKDFGISEADAQECISIGADVSNDVATEVAAPR